MHVLSASDLLHIWEWGQGRTPLQQGLVILSVAYPEASPERLAALTIGQRDGQLLALRARVFGSQMQAVAHCPHCSEALEYGLDVNELTVTSSAVTEAVAEDTEMPAPRVYDWRRGDYQARFRLLTSADFLAVAARSPDQAQTQLLQRCLSAVFKKEQAVAPESLPDEIIQDLSAHIAEQDPQAEILLNLTCTACEHQWSQLFDIVSFFWKEIAVSAQRLLQEVHLLASVYSWREADILSMSRLRRQAYLRQISGEFEGRVGA